MKRKVQIFLILLVLAANLGLHQFIKIPVLVHHYQEHKSFCSSEGFFEFLSIHYIYPLSHASDEHGDHENLPFKTKDFQNTNYFDFKNRAIEVVTIEIIEVSQDLPMSKNQFFDSIRYSKIWHPPC